MGEHQEGILGDKTTLSLLVLAIHRALANVVLRKLDRDEETDGHFTFVCKLFLKSCRTIEGNLDFA